MTQAYGETVVWEPHTPKSDPLRLIVSWAILGLSVLVAAALVPGVALEKPGAGLLVALALAFLNAIIPPVFAALRLPFMVAIGFIAMLFIDAGLLMAVDAA